MNRYTFRRMTIAERGHFPNAIRTWPVTEVSTDEDGISLTRRGQQRRYKWSDIRWARIRNEEVYKGYGAYSSGKMIRRTFTLKTSDGNEYAWDVSANFPDFAKTHVLLAILNEHLAITESPLKRFNHALWIAIVAVTGLTLWIVVTALGL